MKEVCRNKTHFFFITCMCQNSKVYKIQYSYTVTLLISTYVHITR